ncbi:FecR family protein [Nitrospina sp. 32_T5]|uniref:FecR family protein n=1 Tax=unclassified Nitrospina TaxID=2638683 RepID=UPI003F944301
MTRDPRDEPHSVSDEAIAWFTRLQSGDVTEETLRQFETWRASSPLHAVEYDRISSIWNDLDGLKPGIDSKLAGKESPVPASMPFPVRTGRRAGFRGGTSLVILLVILLGGSLWLPDAWVRITSDHYTNTGERRTLALADGSTVYLDTDSALSVEFSPQARRLVLDRGCALFVVAKDMERPFEVVADGGTVRALGTAFEVRRRSGRVVVTVLESRVQVVRDSSKTNLVSGQQVHYDSNAGLSDIDMVDRGKIASWRRGKLVFNNQTLAEVIEEVNRYRKGAILILDPKLRASRVSGIFDITDPELVLHALKDTLPIRIHRVTDYLILLDRNETPPPTG